MKYDLEERLIDFAVDISEIVEKYPDSRIGNYIAGQLIRSGVHPHLIMAKHRQQNQETISSIK